VRRRVGSGRAIAVRKMRSQDRAVLAFVFARYRLRVRFGERARAFHQYSVAHRVSS
jgi:hypothetical protein